MDYYPSSTIRWDKLVVKERVKKSSFLGGQWRRPQRVRATVGDGGRRVEKETRQPRLPRFVRVASGLEEEAEADLNLAAGVGKVAVGVGDAAEG